MFLSCVGRRAGAVGSDGRCRRAAAGRGAVSIDRAAAHRFRVPLTHGLRFCHYLAVARCQLL